MKKLLLLPCILYIMCVSVVSCSKDKAETHVEVANLVDLFPGYRDLDSGRQTSVLDSLRPELTAFMQVVNQSKAVEATPEELCEWCNSPAVRFFTSAVDSVFPDKGVVSKIVSGVLSNAKKNGLDIPEMRYASVVWGQLKSMMFNDSVLLIALNHYLGLDYEGYLSFPAYARHFKSPEYLPYDVAEAVVAHAYPMKDAENSSLLSRMLYDGALVYARMKLVENADAPHALPMLVPHYKWLDENERNIWQAMAAKKLIYSTNQADIDKVMLPSPATTLIHPMAPGRVGRYVGYKIVEAYMKKHPDTPMEKLFQPDFYANPQTLVDASYNP